MVVEGLVVQERFVPGNQQLDEPLGRQTGHSILDEREVVPHDLLQNLGALVRWDGPNKRTGAIEVPAQFIENRSRSGWLYQSSRRKRTGTQRNAWVQLDVQHLFGAFGRQLVDERVRILVHQSGGLRDAFKQGA
ncbi:hypothetical protein B7767_04460 [Streptomyces sp. 13-12-16]|nr:hypothetical protein B7767_04460 [Streptomyces sp. 13-12-16]